MWPGLAKADSDYVRWLARRTLVELKREMDEAQSTQDSEDADKESRLLSIEAALTVIGQQPTAVSPLFPVWAEENSSLGTVTAEWAFGNGANTPTNQGIVLPVAATLVAGTLCLRQGTASVEILKNGLTVHTIVAGSGATPSYSNSPVSPEIPFSAGDCVGFRTLVSAGTGSPNTVCAWFREVT